MLPAHVAKCARLERRAGTRAFRGQTHAGKRADVLAMDNWSLFSGDRMRPAERGETLMKCVILLYQHEEAGFTSVLPGWW
jgi:hypothetical protein